MKTCATCNTEMTEQAKFCKACGAGSGKTTAAFDEKKARVMVQERSWARPAMIVTALLLAVGGGFLLFRESLAGRAGGASAGAPRPNALTRYADARPVIAQAGEVRIPRAEVDDGNAHFFAYASGGKTITFFAMKAGDGTIRTAFDACLACNHAKLGYRQQGGRVECNNCGMGFSAADIGRTAGGCNPIPLATTAEGGNLVFSVKDLEAGRHYF